MRGRVCVCVRVCVRARARVCVCIFYIELRLNPCLHYELAFLYMFLIIFYSDNISISKHIMRAILGLFSALSRRVGVLQIPMIIIIIIIIIQTPSLARATTSRVFWDGANFSLRSATSALT